MTASTKAGFGRAQGIFCSDLSGKVAVLEWITVLIFAIMDLKRNSGVLGRK